MNDVVLSFIDINGQVNYGLVIPVFLGYLALFWVVVSIWIYFDAKKRFESNTVVLLIAFGNLLFLVPFFLVYLLFRPMEEEFIEMHNGQNNNGGVNVPIVNFVGQDGVAMTLELKINNNKLITSNASEMKIDVSFDTHDENKKIVDMIEAVEQRVDNTKKDVKNIVKDFFAKFKRVKKDSKIGELIEKVDDEIKESVKEVSKVTENVVNKVEDEKDEIVNKLFKKNKKTKKK